MRVSVIIPVFNAARFVEEAVLSALDQAETGEVLLIDDGSTDGSYAICQRLAGIDHRVKLLFHPGHQNLGAGATRNLGLQRAAEDYIAFLDVDDFYLPSRFTTTQKVLNAHPDADGVYETIGALYSDTSFTELHLRRMGSEHTGLIKKVPPERLFSALSTGKYGHIHLNGLVIVNKDRDELLTFDTSLKQCEDSDWILRLANRYALYSGEPSHLVAMRRVHGGNSVLNSTEAIHYQRRFLYKCIAHDFYGSRDIYSKLYLVARYVSWGWHGRLRRLGALSRPAIYLATGIYLISHPLLLFRMIFV
ncbi:MAG TPA: glycosyltransferase family 2 protein [Saprospiraceae bacterium]|nr:glycosyltransferase family 2 protein [Saprospiraceae bacterium]